MNFYALLGALPAMLIAIIAMVGLYFASTMKEKRDQKQNTGKKGGKKRR